MRCIGKVGLGFKTRFWGVVSRFWMQLATWSCTHAEAAKERHQRLLMADLNAWWVARHGSEFATGGYVGLVHPGDTFAPINHGQDARATQSHGQDARATQSHGQDARATSEEKQ